MGVGPHNLDIDPAWRKHIIARLLRGQRADGGFGVHPYSKWTGAHWRLVSLVEMGTPARNPGARLAARSELGWIAHSSRIAMRWLIAGRERRHASMEGNAIAVCCRLGSARDPRVLQLVEVLLRTQWPDGGWNCDANPAAHRSSFHETLGPIWGLVEYHRATGDRDSLASAKRAGGAPASVELVDWGDAHQVVTPAALAMLQ